MIDWAKMFAYRLHKPTRQMNLAIITSHYFYVVDLLDHLRTLVLSLISRQSKFNSSPKLVSISGSPSINLPKVVGRPLAFYLTLLLYILLASPIFSLFPSLPPSLSFSFTPIFFTFLQRAPSFVFPFYTSLMNVSQIYATIVGDLFLVFVFVNLLSREIRERIALFMSKHLTYSYLLYCYRLLNS